MKDREVLYSDGKHDDCYTPAYGVRPLLEFLPSLSDNKIIWCPFDTSDSEFVKIFQANGYNVVYSHIDYGQDYYCYEPDNWDIMISNPPFTNKRQIFERALSFNKPFCLLMSLTWLNDSAPKILFAEKDLQLLMFDRRLKFKGLDKKITFSTAYYCWNFLPKQIVMRKLSEEQPNQTNLTFDFSAV